MTLKRRMVSYLLLLGIATACQSQPLSGADPGVGKTASSNHRTLPRPDHVVIVVEENKSYRQIIGNMAAQYINRLANEGALFTNSFAIGHPSQPNYLALFSGSTHGVPDDRCPISLSGDNLADALRRSGLTFGIYSESMPSIGYEGCFSADGLYARKHNPVVNWRRSPEANMPFDLFPSDYAKLPTVSMVIPNQVNDMHDGRSPLDAIVKGDAWLRTRLDAYAGWARSHNSLLIVTWDEDDDSSNNQVATIFVGPMVAPGKYRRRIDHFDVLRTILDMYGLAPFGQGTNARPITEIWN